MGRRSKADLYDLTDRILELYTQKKMTNKEIARQLQSEGYNISHEAVRRSVKESKTLALEMRKCIEESRVIMDAVRDDPNTDLAEAVVSRFAGLLFRESQAIDELAFDDPGEAVNAVSKLASAQVKLGGMRLKYRSGAEAAKRAVITALKKELSGNEDLIEKLSGMVENVQVEGC